mgnify:CR=1 FL=1
MGATPCAGERIKDQSPKDGARGHLNRDVNMPVPFFRLTSSWCCPMRRSLKCIFMHSNSQNNTLRSGIKYGYWKTGLPYAGMPVRSNSIWRRRVRIEHTHRGIATAQTGFEVQAAHQDRSASLLFSRLMSILLSVTIVKYSIICPLSRMLVHL